MIVRHRAYRDYEEWRIASNDAGQAIVTAIRIMTEDVRGLPDDGSRLPVHYGQVREIRRLNVTPARAICILSNAEHYFSAMAVPFFFSVLNEYLVQAVTILVEDAKMSIPKPLERMEFGDLRQALNKSAGIIWPSVEDNLLSVVQHVRNDIIHNAGRAREGLVKCWARCSPGAQLRWRNAAGRQFAPVVGEPLQLGSHEVRATLAVTHAIARATNQELVQLLSRSTWASMAVEDWLASSGASKRSPQAIRKLKGFVRMYYRPVALTEADLEGALARV